MNSELEDIINEQARESRKKHVAHQIFNNPENRKEKISRLKGRNKREKMIWVLLTVGFTPEEIDLIRKKISVKTIYRSIEKGF